MRNPETVVKKGHRGENPGPGPHLARPPGGKLDNGMESEPGGQTVRDVVREHEQGDGCERGDELRHVVVGDVARGREHEQAHDDQRGRIRVAQGLRPMAIEPKAAARIVATVLGPLGNPAKARIAGLTTMMYAIVVKVVMPPRISVRTVAPRFSISKKSAGTAAMVLFCPPDLRQPTSMRLRSACINVGLSFVVIAVTLLVMEGVA